MSPKLKDCVGAEGGCAAKDDHEHDRRTCPAYFHTDECAELPPGMCVCPRGWDGSEPLTFNRQGIIDAYVTFAYVNARDLSKSAGDPLVEHAWRARVERVKEHADVDPSWHCTTQEEAIDALDDDVREHYFALCAKRLGEAGREIREDYTRRNRLDGFTVSVRSNDDDPFMLDLTVEGSGASAWANAHGSMAGGTWENSDDTMVYDTAIWHDTLIADWQKEGYALDLSGYSPPDPADHRAARHRWLKDGNERGCCSSHHEALEHCEKITQERLARRAARREEALQAFARALYVVSYADAWTLPALFAPEVLYPAVPYACAS
jgi:hypothetical protein